MKGEIKMKKDHNKILLEEEIGREIEDLAALDPGSKEKSTAIEDLTKLYKLKIEETKTEMEFDDKRERLVMENDQHITKMETDRITMLNDISIKEEQIKELKNDRYFRTGIAAAEIILPLVFYATWMKKGFKFEETGTFTSQTFKGLFGRFKPTKK